MGNEDPEIVVLLKIRWKLGKSDVIDAEHLALITEVAAQDPATAITFFDGIGLLPPVYSVDPKLTQELYEYGLRRAFDEKDGRGNEFNRHRTLHAGDSRHSRENEREFQQFREYVDTRNFYKTPGMEWWLKWSEVSKQKLVFINSFIAGFAASGNVPVGVLTGIVASLVTNLGKMSPEEVEMYNLFVRESPDGQKFKEWFTREELLAGMPEGDALTARKQLAEMASKGYVKEVDGLYRLVR